MRARSSAVRGRKPLRLLDKVSVEDDATIRQAAVHNLTGSYALWRLEVIGTRL